MSATSPGQVNPRVCLTYLLFPPTSLSVELNARLNTDDLLILDFSRKLAQYTGHHIFRICCAYKSVTRIFKGVLKHQPGSWVAWRKSLAHKG